MKCHQHYDNDAVSQCVDCGRGLCPKCTSRWTIPICDSCNLNRASNEKKAIIRNIILMIPLFILGYNFFAGEMPLSVKLMYGYIFAGLPWGWSVLNRITPNVFLFLPIFGWIVYFVLKLGIAMLIGEFVLPYKIYTFIRDYKKAQTIQSQIKSIS